MSQGMYSEEVYRPAPFARGRVMGLTALDQARAQLCALDNRWCVPTGLYDAAHLKYHICCEDPTIFVNDPLRLAICGSQSVPAYEGCKNPPGEGGDNTMMILGVGALAVLGVVAVVVASKGKKKVLVASA